MPVSCYGAAAFVRCANEGSRGLPSRSARTLNPSSCSRFGATVFSRGEQTLANIMLNRYPAKSAQIHEQLRFCYALLFIESIEASRSRRRRRG